MKSPPNVPHYPSPSNVCHTTGYLRTTEAFQYFGVREPCSRFCRTTRKQPHFSGHARTCKPDPPQSRTVTSANRNQPPVDYHLSWLPLLTLNPEGKHAPSEDIPGDWHMKFQLTRIALFVSSLLLCLCFTASTQDKAPTEA